MVADPPPPRRLRRRRLALLGASLLVSLLIGEAAVRLLGLAGSGRGEPWFAGGNHPRYLFQPDPRSGYRLRPGFTGRQVGRAASSTCPWRWTRGACATMRTSRRRGPWRSRWATR